MKNIAILGASGGCLDILSLIERINERKKSYKFLGFFEDTPDKIPSAYKKYHIGKFSQAKNVKNTYFSTAIGNEKNFFYRKQIINKLKIDKSKFIALIDPSVILDVSTKIGKGVVIFNSVCLSRNVRIGDFCVILPKTSISHDTEIGGHSIINASVTISGNTRIGKNCYIGTGTNVRDHINTKENIIIGMGSNVISNLEKKDSIYFGNPCKFVKKLIIKY
tara:strand:- start:114 stop:773 length:660 start_codon:yes stop_codon:yes gene_type:complete